MDVLPTGARANAGQHRFLHGVSGTPTSKHGDSREVTPRLPGQPGRKPRKVLSSVFRVLADCSATPLNLSNAASLDLLSTDEQQLCSSLRVLPKPYLVIKDLYIRENERRRGLLKRRDARYVSLLPPNHHELTS
jgi:transcriptional adapter 2-alpha